MSKSGHNDEALTRQMTLVERQKNVKSSDPLKDAQRTFRMIDVRDKNTKQRKVRLEYEINNLQKELDDVNDQLAGMEESSEKCKVDAHARREQMESLTKCISDSADHQYQLCKQISGVKNAQGQIAAKLSRFEASNILEVERGYKVGTGSTWTNSMLQEEKGRRRRTDNSSSKKKQPLPDNLPRLADLVSTLDAGLSSTKMLNSSKRSTYARR